MIANKLYLAKSEKWGAFIIEGFGNNKDTNKAISLNKWNTRTNNKTEAFKIAKKWYPSNF